MTSLRSRLGLGLVVSLIVMIGLLLFIAGTSVRSLMEEQLATRLAHDGEALLGGLTIQSDGSLSLDAGRVQGIYRQPFSGHYFLIQVEDHAIRSRSLWDETLLIPEVHAGETLLSYISGPQQQPLLLWTRGFRKNGKLVRLSVAEQLLALEAGARHFQWRLLTWSLTVLFLLLLIQQIIIVYSLRPVSEAADDVARLEQGEISALTEQVPREVQPLVLAINKLLQRQQQRLVRSREALGNLAHAIKTPLTVLQQLASETIPDADKAAHAQLDVYVRQISKLVDISLRRARLAGNSTGTSRFDLQQDLPALVDTVSRLHQQRSISFRQDLNHIKQLPIEQQDGMELLGNLLDNAWKWARSTVYLKIEDSMPMLITIEDDGPGVEAVELNSLTQRGVRHDESRPGHGIGLSIVSSLVAELGGTTEITRSVTLGGLKVKVQL